MPGALENPCLCVGQFEDTCVLYAKEAKLTFTQTDALLFIEYTQTSHLTKNKGHTRRGLLRRHSNMANLRSSLSPKRLLNSWSKLNTSQYLQRRSIFKDRLAKGPRTHFRPQTMNTK
jgi:hypothetical protein